MTTLHRLIHDLVLVNPDLIERVEACPDTLLRLTNGSSMLVAETPDEVAECILAWRRQVMQEAVTAH